MGEWSCEHCGRASVGYRLRDCFECGAGMCFECEEKHDAMGDTCPGKYPSDGEESPGQRWWSWLHYGPGKCPGKPDHPNARRQGACWDCWDRLIEAVRAEVLAEREDSEQITEKIAAAALRVNGEVWTLPPPARHCHLVNTWSAAHWIDGEPGRIPKHEQGFLTSRGRFLDRAEALELALAVGQLEQRPMVTPTRLYTEDLW